MSMTRREFLIRVVRVGGSVYGAMLTLGLLKMPAARAFSLARQVAGTRVIILGAGLAWICSDDSLYIRKEIGRFPYAPSDAW